MFRTCVCPVLTIMIASAIASAPVHADSTDQQLSEQETGEFEPAVRADDVFTPETQDRLSGVLKKFERLDRHFRLMDAFGAEDELQRSLEELRADPRAAEEVTKLYETLTELAVENKQYFGEARWRALHLLGELRNPEAADFLADVASRPMPRAGEVDETGYRVAFRLRARAIEGLEKLGEVDRLTEIYEEGGIMAGVAAASLYELDAAPDGIVKVDGLEVLGRGDPTDYNPAKGEAGAELPRVRRPTPGEDQSLTPTFPSSK